MMYKSGKFDVIEDPACHVTDSQPIGKSLQHFRPDQLFRRTTTQPVIGDVTPYRPVTSDGTLFTRETENVEQYHLSAVNTSEINAVGYQPQIAAAVVSKSGAEFQPEVKHRQVPSKGSFEATGSLRDRWRQLNDEFKLLYQQRSKSPQTTPSQGQVHAQGQRNAPKVNRFQDIDRRFSNLSRAVGNMRLHSNSTSGRTGIPEVTSAKPEAVFLPTTGNGEGCERIAEAATREEILSEPSDPTRQATQSMCDYFASLPRQRSLSEERSELSYQHRVPVISPTELISRYPGHQSTIHGQAGDQRPGSILYNRHPGRTDNRAARRQTQQTAVLAPGECEYKTRCKFCGKIITLSVADADDDVDGEDAIISERSRDMYTKEKQPRTMRKSRGAQVDDVTGQADVRNSAMLMTSSPRRAWAEAERMSEERWKMEKRIRQTQQHQDGLGDDVGLVGPLRRRCSCGCDSTPSPTGNMLSPEVEMSRSRDVAMTSSCDGRSVCGRSGRVKPDIEMNRQQVLRVYVLNDNTSDVTGHVVRAPVGGRGVSTAATSRRSVSNIPAKSRHSMTSRASNPDISCCCRTTTSFPVATSDERSHRPTRSVDQAVFSLRSPTSDILSPQNMPALRQSDTRQSDIWTASMDRKRTESSTKKSAYKKPTLYSSDSNPGQVAATSLDRGNVQCFRKNGSRGLDQGRRLYQSSSDKGERKERRRFAKKSEKTMYKILDGVEFHVDKPTSVCVGTTSSAAPGRTPRRQSDDGGKTGRFDAVEGRRRTSKVPTECGTVDRDFRHQSSSLERDGGPVSWHPRRLFNKNSDWMSSRGTKTRDRRQTRDPVDDVDLVNPGWIRRRIHLPVARRMRLMSQGDASRLPPRRTSDDGGRSDRGLVSSRTDPDNVCFRHRSTSNCVVPSGTELVYQTQSADPAVRVEFTRDLNGNLLKVTEVVTETDSCHSSDVAGHVTSPPEVDCDDLAKPEVVRRMQLSWRPCVTSPHHAVSDVITGNKMAAVNYRRGTVLTAL